MLSEQTAKLVEEAVGTEARGTVAFIRTMSRFKDALMATGVFSTPSPTCTLEDRLGAVFEGLLFLVYQVRFDGIVLCVGWCPDVFASARSVTAHCSCRGRLSPTTRCTLHLTTRCQAPCFAT